MMQTLANLLMLMVVCGGIPLIVFLFIKKLFDQEHKEHLKRMEELRNGRNHSARISNRHDDPRR